MSQEELIDMDDFLGARCPGCGASMPFHLPTCSIKEEQNQVLRNARQVLRSTSREFFDGFASGCPGAVVLDTKQPIIVWVDTADTGKVNFLVVSEFCGPRTVRNDAPLVLRVRTNLDPPDDLWMELRSTVLRSQLGLGPYNPFESSDLSNDPRLELVGYPQEVAALGPWLWSWIDGRRTPNAVVPIPPIPVVAVRVDPTTLKDIRIDVTTLGAEWRRDTYFWTSSAAPVWDDFLANIDKLQPSSPQPATGIDAPLVKILVEIAATGKMIVHPRGHAVDFPMDDDYLAGLCTSIFQEPDIIGQALMILRQSDGHKDERLQRVMRRPELRTLAIRVLHELTGR